MLDYFEGLKEVKKQANEIKTEFGEVFGLRAFPGLEFTVSESASYYSDSEGVLLYSYSRKAGSDEKWLAFAKGTVANLRANIVKLKQRRFVVAVAFKYKPGKRTKTEVEALDIKAVNESEAINKAIDSLFTGGKYPNYITLSYKFVEVKDL